MKIASDCGLRENFFAYRITIVIRKHRHVWTCSRKQDTWWMWMLLSWSTNVWCCQHLPTADYTYFVSKQRKRITWSCYTEEQNEWFKNSKEILSVSSANRKQACQFFQSCLYGKVINPLNDCLTLSLHQKNKRSNAKMVILHRLKKNVEKCPSQWRKIL